MQCALRLVLPPVVDNLGRLWNTFMCWILVYLCTASANLSCLGCNQRLAQSHRILELNITHGVSVIACRVSKMGRTILRIPEAPNWEGTSHQWEKLVHLLKRRLTVVLRRG